MIKFAQSAYQFVLDAKIRADLGYSWPSAIRFAWSVLGWQTARA